MVNALCEAGIKADAVDAIKAVAATADTNFILLLSILNKGVDGLNFNVM
jgi:hypothetical protein